jgi:NACHT domain- and WD repeat-containing protein
MAQSSRTFRVFVSSTFSDLKAERNALQEKVFPRLRDLAAAHGCRFQAIDLRWGVSEEAALDQQTMKICLGEIERCQRVSPRPNFIVLLGDRYGWQPIPSEIPASEFEKIIEALDDRGERLLVESWYRRDDNAIPAVFCLQPRTDEFVDPEKWASAEATIHTILEREARKLHLTPGDALKYNASATEQEIDAGAMRVPDAREHVFCFFRDILSFPEDGSAASFQEKDVTAAQKQIDLQKRLKEHLPGNVHEYSALWQADGPSLGHLDQLCSDVYADLSKVIQAEAGKLEKVDPVEAEISAHEIFGKERARVFVGRVDILKSIADYIAGDDPNPLVIWGESGCGKSALMAKMIDQARQNGKDVLYRFIGATPESSNGRALLESLCKQISLRYGNVPFERSYGQVISTASDYLKVVKEFPSRLRHANPDKPIILFLDALDQLSDSDNARDLSWLPQELPPNVRIVLSTLPGDCLETLINNVPTKNLLKVDPMPVEDGLAVLDTWFTEIHRTLQREQEKYILDKFSECRIPLYLKLAFEEGRLWKSYEPLVELSSDIPGIIRDLFTRLSSDTNHGRILVSHSLGYLSASKNGLTEDELLDVLSLDKEMMSDFLRRSPKSPHIERLPMIILSRLHFDLGPYLIHRSADGASLLFFYHRQMTQACQAAFLNQSRHSGLATYFSPQPLYLDQFELVPNLRKLSEMVYQQTLAGFPDQVEKALLNYGYLEAKLAGKGIHELIEDYNLVSRAGVGKEKEKSLALVQGALRLSTPVLVKDPLQLPSQLTGRLMEFSETDLCNFLVQIRRQIKRPWLRPLHAFVESPSGALLRTMEDGQCAIMALMPDGRCTVSVGEEAVGLKVLNLENGTCIRSIVAPNMVSAIAVTPDGRWVVLGTEKGTVEVWDLKNGKCLRILEGYRWSVSSIAITPDGRRAVSGMSDFTGVSKETIVDCPIKVWDLESGDCLFTLRGHTRMVSSLAITPDGQQIVSGSADRTIKVWDLESGNCLRTLQGQHTDEVACVALSKDGLKVVSASYDKSLKIWDLKSGACMKTLEGHAMRVYAVALTPDGRNAISGSEDKTLKVWDLESGACINTLVGHTRAVVRVAITPDGCRAVSSSYGSLKVWDLQNNSNPRAQSWHTLRVERIKLTNNGRCAISTCGDQTLKVWDVGSGILLRTLAGHKQVVKSPIYGPVIALTPDSRTIVSAAADDTLKIWEIESGSCLRTLVGHKDSIIDVALTPDGRLAVSTSSDNTIKVWNIESGKCLHTLRGHKSCAKGLVLSPDGRRAVSYDYENSIKVWDILTGACLRTLMTGHTRSIIYMVLTPDGLRAISISYDQSLKIWDLESGSCLFTLNDFAYVRGLEVSPDGRFTIVPSSAGTTIWDLESGTLLRILQDETRPHLGSVIVTPDGRHAISTPESTFPNAMLKIWDFERGTCLANYLGDSLITCTACTPGGSTLAVGEESGAVYFLRLENVIPGPTIVTAWRFSKRSFGWKKSVTINRQLGLLAFGCPLCRSWSEIPQSALGSVIPCPNCKKALKFNSFTIQGDWKPVAKAWKPSQSTLSPDSDKEGISVEAFRQQLIDRTTGTEIGSKTLLGKTPEQLCRDIGELFGKRDYINTTKLAHALEEICRRSGNKVYLQYALGVQADVHFALGVKEEAQSLPTDKEQICRYLQNQDFLQKSYEQQVYYLHPNLHYESALSLWKEQAELCYELGDKDGIQRTLGNQARMLHIRGDLDRAMELYKEEEKICREMKNYKALKISLSNQISVLRVRGDFEGAMRLQKEIDLL